MIVTRSGLLNTLIQLAKEPRLSLDTETTGLRMYHGDRLFSIIISNKTEAFYFNFIPYEKLGPDFILGGAALSLLQAHLFMDPNRVWFIQNAANFDLPILGVEGLVLEGTIHCTKAIARVVFNASAHRYSLASLLEEIGDKKLDVVANYIKEHKLVTKTDVPGKNKQDEKPHYDRVPFEIIVPYGEQDALGTFNLGEHQINKINEVSDLGAERSVLRVMENERRLQKTIYRMKHRGLLIDKKYCERAIAYEKDRGDKATLEFKKFTGVDFKASAKVFSEVFKSDTGTWGFTDKGNPSFESDILSKFANPAAKEVLKIRDAKSKKDFYEGFLHHADRDGILHPNFDPGGTVHGRFSSSEPNFQNLTSEESEEEINQEFLVRRAIIPRPGFILIMPDYDQMEYKFMLEQACNLIGEHGSETELSKLIAGGMDFHDATALNVKKVTGLELPRKQIKIVNFMTLYGSGIQNIADTLGVEFKKAQEIKYAILEASPEIRTYMKAISSMAEIKGHITNWLGRRCYFQVPQNSYRAPNYHVSGGCADVVKVAMNEIDEYLLDKKSKMIMTVHDELPIEIHETEVGTVPRYIKQIMESVYPARYVPLTTGMEYSEKSLADKNKGFPVG